ncbi:MAG: pyridoxal-phosphate dependent enzyme [Myxococcales bacterium]|nr:pyridoxal-phosphate dependent enzyme [Myxococcales bacterium]
MAPLGLEDHVVDRGAYDSSVERFREAGIRLPRFSELADPSTIPDAIEAALAKVEPDAAHPLNLFRVHWYNGPDRSRRVEVPDHIVLEQSLTGVAAPIIVALGDRFPMIRAHKVLAAYGVLAPRIITGQFDPARHKALWPSTGNYCRGGVAISKIMGCRGVAVLPEGMSRERFEWLDAWTERADDIIRTPGSESNVKEIYDACNELSKDPSVVVFNQFSELGNHLVHYLCTGKALERVFDHVATDRPGLRLHAFTSATGSAGTIAAGDYLKEQLGARIVAVEAQECPTLLENGFGEHNIQGIGDKHVPLIHNVMNTDILVGVSDHSTDCLDLLFNTDAGRRYLVERRGLAPEVVDQLSCLGFSGICNVLAAIKVARLHGLGPNDALITVATDSAAMYTSERPRLVDKHFGGRFDEISAAEAFGEHLAGVRTDWTRELDHHERLRVFNLGYYTWTEQQGVSVQDFVARRDQSFWRELRGLLARWDGMIDEFNEATGV